MFQFICPPMPHYIIGSEDTYPAGGKHAARSNIGVFDLIVVTRGCLYMEEDGERIDIAAGHYAILRPDRPHRTAQPCLEETHFHWLHFQTVGDWSVMDERQPFAVAEQSHPFAQIEYFPFYLPRHRRLQAPQDIAEKLRELQLLHEQPSAHFRFVRQQLFQALLLKLQEESGGAADSPYWHIAEEAALYLRKHYKDPLRYKQMAEELHFHPNYIAICMKKAFGCTPLEYLTRHRIEQAKRLLIHTNEPIGKIAEDTGFGSFPYFVRCFGKHAGRKPKKFRMQYRSAQKD
ncbi:helix-turn-helix transcriptional regulator [Paenibacillus arenilitoris]|uniref:Helix-turn-helix transcriptional regulator n=1 Tax=Paenibacillus arenilitoris TaxID=2772299 RepID=A0A927CKC0_9BACL|nr:helix-turn-helix transcriptional regulator [Paenibacillus arenilitoris]MBD2867476.1 helix-turn-helix transcriptional regulator [Paenibacillus arenilitoris]